MICSSDYIDVSNTQYSEEVLDTDFLNNYNMTDNIDEKFDHTFFSDIESLYFSENDFNNNLNHSNNLSFIHINICSIPKNFKKNELFLSNLKHEFKVICCSESWLKNSTRDRYTPKGFTHVFD